MGPPPMPAVVCVCMGQATESMHKALAANLSSLLELLCEHLHNARGCVYPIAHTPRNHGHSVGDSHAKQEVRIWSSHNENHLQTLGLYPSHFLPISNPL